MIALVIPNHAVRAALQGILPDTVPVQVFQDWESASHDENIILYISTLSPNDPALPVLLLDGAGPATAMPVAALLARIQGFLKESAEDALTARESRLLDILHKAAPEPVSREQLLENVWEWESGLDTHALETHIWRLRQKLARLGDRREISTVTGGYQLVLPVS